VTPEREKAVSRAEAAAYWEANAEAWTQHSRAGYDVYRDALNTPAFLTMLPPVSGLLGLDIGCGEGSNTRELVRLGASMHAVDVAPTFILHAPRREPTRGGSCSTSPMRLLCRLPTTHSTS